MKLKYKQILQLVAAFLGIIIANVGSQFYFGRFDLTEEKRYTLSDHTKTVLHQIPDKVYLKIYLSGDDLPIGFKKMNRAIDELLDEFQVYAGAKLEYEFINPSESASKKVRMGMYEELNKKGVVSVISNQSQKEDQASQKVVYPGAIILYKGKELVVNLLKNHNRSVPDSEDNIKNSIQTLEYEFINALHKLFIEKKQRIAFIEGHGELSEPELIDISTRLSERYSVERGAVGGKIGVLSPFKVVIVAGPVNEFPEADKIVLDQYLMQGGKIVWLIDGTHVVLDSLRFKPFTLAMPAKTNLSQMLYSYGARINPDVVQDYQSSFIKLATGQETSQQAQYNFFPWYFSPLLVTDNSHVINKYLDLIKLDFASSVDTVGSSLAIKRSVLLTSSAHTKTGYAPVEVNLEHVLKPQQKTNFQSGEKSMAVLLEGQFESFYKNRPQYTQGLKNFLSASKPTAMIVVGDGDIIRNDLSPDGNPFPLGFDRNTGKIFEGNRDFIINAINYLADDKGLMQLRNREMKLRILDKEKVAAQKSVWQIFNSAVPILIIVFFGLIINYVRKRNFG